MAEDINEETGILTGRWHQDKYSAVSHGGLGVIAHGLVEVFPQNYNGTMTIAMSEGEVSKIDPAE